MDQRERVPSGACTVNVQITGAVEAPHPRSTKYLHATKVCNKTHVPDQWAQCRCRTLSRCTRSMAKCGRSRNRSITEGPNTGPSVAGTTNVPDQWDKCNRNPYTPCTCRILLLLGLYHTNHRWHFLRQAMMIVSKEGGTLEP